MRRRKMYDPLQLSLWNKFDDMTDSQILAGITRKEEFIDDDSFGSYRMQKIFNRLTPHTRRVAESVIELYKRRDIPKIRHEKMTNSMAVSELMQPKIGDITHEEFWIIGLNNNNKMIAHKRISMGGLDQTAADVRIIFRELILMNATAFIAVHNHPSGNLHPSRQDKELTKKIAQAGSIMSIRLLDHIIIASDGYYSFNDEGVL